jgi:hypothetical protein
VAGFSSYDDIINEVTVNGKGLDWNFFKIGPTMEGAGVWGSHWYASGSPGAGSNPAATPGTAYDDDVGSIYFADTTTDQKHILTFGAAASQNCTLMLYDRLVGVSGLSVASTGNKTVSSTGLPRYTSSAASVVEAWLEVTTATTTTAAIVSMNSYTNEGGTTGRAGGTVTFPATATDVRTMIKMPLQAGDKGVQDCSTINVATAASAGVVNFLLIRPLVFLPLIANIWNERDCVLQFTSLPRVFDGASLAIAQLATATTATNVWGRINLAYG